MNTSPMQPTRGHQALALGLSVLVTAALLAGLLGQAGSDRGALLAQQLQRMQPAAGKALASVPAAPGA